jgi:RNase P/RNase MRP subunit p30
MDITLVKQEKALFFKKISSKNELKEDKVDGYLIDSDEKEIRKIYDVLKAKEQKFILAVLGKDDEFNRRIIETCKINYLVLPGSQEDKIKDTLKQRTSGLNHVVAKIAKEKSIGIIINFSSFINKNAKLLSILLARTIQNIKICRKSSCVIKIATFAESKEQTRNENELKSFLFSLGASSQQVAESTEL